MIPQCSKNECTLIIEQESPPNFLRQDVAVRYLSG